MNEEPLWKRIVMASKEIAKGISEETIRKVEAVIAETVCVEEEPHERKD